VWFIGIAAVLILLAVVIVGAEGPAPMPYSAFFDQLEAGNVASVTFQGMQISGRFKRPLDGTLSTGTTQRDSFSTRVPDVGDSALMPELRKQRVAIDVSVPSAWTWLLGRVPWPLLLIFGAMIVAGIVRLVRGGKAQSGSAMSVHPMQGMMGLLSGLFGKQQQAASPPSPDRGEPKSRWDL
jgi:ATP-dependent Zn protease